MKGVTHPSVEWMLWGRKGRNGVKLVFNLFFSTQMVKEARIQEIRDIFRGI